MMLGFSPLWLYIVAIRDPPRLTRETNIWERYQAEMTAVGREWLQKEKNPQSKLQKLCSIRQLMLFSLVYITSTTELLMER